eukprot:scaffold103331_cov27-Tisochrysis_lutea.AAC.2
MLAHLSHSPHDCMHLVFMYPGFDSHSPFRFQSAQLPLPSMHLGRIRTFAKRSHGGESYGTKLYILRSRNSRCVRGGFDGLKLSSHVRTTVCNDPLPAGTYPLELLLRWQRGQIIQIKVHR